MNAEKKKSWAYVAAYCAVAVLAWFWVFGMTLAIRTAWRWGE